jgi:hypothetical protein
MRSQGNRFESLSNKRGEYESNKHDFVSLYDSSHHRAMINTFYKSVDPKNKVDNRNDYNFHSTVNGYSTFNQKQIRDSSNDDS